MHNQSQPSFIQHPSADPTKGTGTRGPETLRRLLTPKPSTPANPANDTDIEGQTVAALVFKKHVAEEKVGWYQWANLFHVDHPSLSSMAHHSKDGVADNKIQSSQCPTD